MSLATAKNAKNVYQMPEVNVGDDVLLLANLTDENNGGLGIVVSVHKRAIDVIHHRTRQMFIGLRHKSDPDLVTHPTLLHDTHGCWVETSKMRRIAQLEGDVMRLASQIADLSNAVKELTDELKRIRKPA